MELGGVALLKIPHRLTDLNVWSQGSASSGGVPCFLNPGLLEFSRVTELMECLSKVRDFIVVAYSP